MQGFLSFSTAIVTHAQSGAYSSCGSLQHYIDGHPHMSCYIYEDSCSGMSCYGYGINGTNYVSTSFTVQKCEDPVTVYTYASISIGHHYFSFSYEFNKSETIDSDGHYYYYYDYDYDYDYNLSSYTAILDRNASHLGFEVHNVYTCTCM